MKPIEYLLVGVLVLVILAVMLMMLHGATLTSALISAAIFLVVVGLIWAVVVLFT